MYTHCIELINYFTVIKLQAWKYEVDDVRHVS